MAIVLLISIGVSHANGQEVLLSDSIGTVASMEQIAWPEMEQTDIERGRVENLEGENRNSGAPWLLSTIQCRNLLKMYTEFHNITN